MAKAAQAGVQALEWGIAERALPGQKSSGDQSLVRPLTQGVLVGVIDALGHGDDAASAAGKASAVLERFSHEPLPSLLQRCHAELVGTRGVVMSLALFRTDEHSMAWLGVGNVEGVLISADARAQPRNPTLVTRGGIVGADLPKVSPWVIPLTRGDTVIFTTDGIRPGFADGVTLTESPQELADRILAKHAKDTDDALVLVVRYLGDA